MRNRDPLEVRRCRRSWMTRACLGMLLTGFLSSGCSLQTHAQKKQQAEERWSGVRARVKFQLARQQYDQGQIDAAIATASEAIALDGSNAAQSLLLAHCYLEQGRPASAREAVDRAARCSPDAPEVAYAYGLLAEEAEDPVAALEHYRKARRGDPRSMDYLVAEAECLVAISSYAEATALVTEHLRSFDSRGTLEMLLAQIALLTGDADGALQWLSAAAEVAGDNPVVAEEYGRALSETGRHEEAVAVLSPFVKDRGVEAPVSAVTSLAGSLMAQGRTREAMLLLQDLVRRRPDELRGWTLLARAAVAQEDWRAARRYVIEMERLSPDGALAHVLRGYICWMEDDPDGARIALERALELDANDPLARELMRRVLGGRGTPAGLSERERRMGDGESDGTDSAGVGPVAEGDTAADGPVPLPELATPG